MDNGGEYAAAPILVTVPVAIPAGSFAMGVYLHDDGTLESMPLVDESPASITVATRHFSSFFITVIAEAALPKDIGTGSRTGEDDIQTPNYGSYIEPGGHCAGQALAELWYFEERTSAGGPQLNGLLGTTGRDETPTFWEDDRMAYRLASMVSRDLDWLTLSGRIELALEKAKVDRFQWNAFRYAMLVTGQPQFVGLSEGDEPGGHVIVAYAATETGLWVADPNDPGKLRDIPWNAGSASFDAYQSGASAKSSKHHYDKIAFYGKTPLVDWEQIGRRWAEAEAGTIGDSEFPGSTLNVAVMGPDGVATWQPLVDGTVLPTAAIRIGYAASPAWQQRATVYRGEVKVVDIDANRDAVVGLAPGVNRLGIYLQGKRDNADEAVDFVYVTVIAPGASASPIPDEPTPTPGPTFDCTATPAPGEIGRMEWILHCQAFSSPIAP